MCRYICTAGDTVKFAAAIKMPHSRALVIFFPLFVVPSVCVCEYAIVARPIVVVVGRSATVAHAIAL